MDSKDPESAQNNGFYAVAIKKKNVAAARIWPQVITTLIVCVSVFASGGVLVWTSPALPDLERTQYYGKMSSTEKSWIASTVTVGAIFSGPVAGFIMDKHGRRKSLLFWTLPLLVGWTVIGFAPSVSIMSTGRFLTGFSIGGFILVSMVYLAEVSEQGIRGMVMSSTAIALASGMLLTYTLGTFFSWFIITVVNIILSIILLLCIRTVPESPVYLIHKGQKKQAGEALMRLRGATEFHQIETELNELECSTLENQRSALGPTEFKKSAQESCSLLKKLLRKGSLKAVGISFGLMVFQQLCGVNAVIFFTATIFSAAKTNLDGNVCAIIVGADILLSVCLTSFLIDKVGRRMLLFISLLGLSLCLATLGIFFYLQRRNDGITPTGLEWVPLASLMLFAILYHIGIGPLAWILMSELIPTDIKGPASAAATSFNWILAFLVTKTFEDFKDLIGIDGCFWVFAAICLIGFVFTILFVPETKGKTLEEIERQYFRKSE